MCLLLEYKEAIIYIGGGWGGGLWKTQKVDFKMDTRPDACPKTTTNGRASWPVTRAKGPREGVG